MALIEFENLPSTDTPISAENLNNNFNELNKINSYSTNETDTGQKWIDGKTIYRKVIDCGALPNATTKNIPTNLSNIFIIKLQGFAYNSNAYLTIPDIIPSGTNYSTKINYDYSNQQIVITAGADRSNMNGYVILEYTKTTD